MRIRRGFLNWGVFLVCLGAVPLAVQLGALDRELAGGILRLWPLVLIGIGLGLLLRFTPLAVVGGMVTAGTFGLLFGVLFAGGFPSAAAGACLGDRAGGATVTRGGTIEGGARVRMDVTCADLELTRGPDADWSAAVTARDPQPLIDATGDRLTLGSADTSGLFLLTGRGRETWLVDLPTPLDTVYVTTNASSGSLDLGGGALLLFSGTINASDLKLDLAGADMSHGPLNLILNASTVTVVLPDGGTGATSDAHVNASSLTLCARPDLGLSINYGEALSSQNFAAAGLVRSGETWQTPGYASATTRIDLRLSANVSSITLDRSGGCQ